MPKRGPLVHARLVGAGRIIYCGARRGRTVCNDVDLRQMINWPDETNERLRKLSWCPRCVDKMIDDIRSDH